MKLLFSAMAKDSKSVAAIMCGDTWADVPGSPHLMVSTSGRVVSFNKKQPRQLKLSRSGIGYKTVGDPRVKRHYLHTLVCETWHGPRPTPKHQVRHINGNMNDNRLDNLAWGTAIQNAADRVIHGTSTDGERNPMSRLTRAKVNEMRRIRQETGAYYSQIAKQFGVSTMTAFRAVTRQSWQGE